MQIDSFIASQILVGIALVTDFASFQFKDRKKILFFLSISTVLIAVHYFLLEKNTAALLVFIALIRFISSYFSSDKRLMWGIIGLNLLGFVFTYSALSSAIIFIAMLLFTAAAFQQKDKHLRLVMMVGTILMITYDVIIFSPVAILLESSFLISNLLGYYRFYVKKNPCSDNVIVE